MRHVIFIAGVFALLSTSVFAADKVVVIPLNGKIKPGTVVEGNLNSSILRVINNSTSGTLGSAISAQGSSPTAPAISAHHTGTGHALYGSSDSVYPTIGGVNNGSGNGVDGRSTSGHGVYGSTSTSDASGVVGLQTGYSYNDLGLWWNPGGLFGGRNGVIGITKANSGYGVYGLDLSTTGGWAGYFISTNGSGVYASVPAGHVGINTNGTKPAVVATDDGARLMYSEESTEVWFTDYGFAQLHNESAIVTFEATFAQTVNLSLPYHVFLQPYGNASLYVTNRTPTGFEVNLNSGDANIAFSYRIVARRLGLENDRLERAPWADNDPNLYQDKASSAASRFQGDQQDLLK